MRRRLLILAGAFLFMVFMQSAVLAQTEQLRPNRLNLTPEQTAKMAELRKQHQEEAAEARAELIKARAEVQSMMAQDNPDLNALELAMNRVSQLENASRIKAIKNAETLKALLTEEQQQMLTRGRGILSFRAIQGMRGTFRGERGSLSNRSRTFRGRRGQTYLNRSGGRGEGFDRGAVRGGRGAGFGRGIMRGGRGMQPSAVRFTIPPGRDVRLRGRNIPPEQGSTGNLREDIFMRGWRNFRDRSGRDIKPPTVPPPTPPPPPPSNR